MNGPGAAATFAGLCPRPFAAPLMFRFARVLPWLLAVGPLLVPAVAAQAQPQATLIFDETFDDNHRNWNLGPVGAVNFSLSGGALLARSTGAGAMQVNKQGLTLSRDYDLEAEVRVSGAALAGLIWAANDAGTSERRDHYYERYYTVLLGDGGQRVTVARSRHEQLEPLLSARPLAPAGKPGASHTLRIERRGLRLRALVDGAEVWGTTGADAADVAAGGLVGYYIEGVGELRVERLRAWEYPLPLALAAPLAPALRRETLPAPVNLPTETQNAPLVSPDGRQLYFIRGPHLNSDIWVAQRQPDSTWADVRPLAALNNADPNSVESISPDGNSALLRGSYNANATQATAKVSLAQRGPDGQWQTPQPLFIQKYPRLTFAHSRVADYFLAPGGLTLLLSISTEDLPDVTDLYASQRQPNGEWSRPVPLGPTLNTPYHDGAPYLAPDGLTLYFSSDGHPGYGSTDIFVSRRLDDTWTSWSPPLNLGPVVNTPGFDTGFSLSAAADYAYFSTGGLIQRLRLPAPARPVPTLLVRGRVMDARTRQPLVADVRYERLPDGQPAGQARAAQLDGAYQLALAVGQHYGFRAEAEGYLSASDNLDLPEALRLRGGTVERNLYLLPIVAPEAAVAAAPVRLRTTSAVPARPTQLAPVKVAAAPAAPTIVLHNIFFVQGKAVLLPSSLPELRRLRQTLLDHPTMVIRLEGHTDIEGDAGPNKLLSEQRVAAVRRSLIGKPTDAPIEPARISTIGYGEERPVVPAPRTEDERRRNRRVELAVLVP